MPSDESKGSQLDAIGSLAQRQLDNTVENAPKSLSRHDGASVIRACRQRCDELVAETLVVPFCVIMHYVFGYRCPQVSLTERRTASCCRRATFSRASSRRSLKAETRARTNDEIMQAWCRQTGD